MEWNEAFSNEKRTNLFYSSSLHNLEHESQDVAPETYRSIGLPTNWNRNDRPLRHHLGSQQRSFSILQWICLLKHISRFSASGEDRIKSTILVLEAMDPHPLFLARLALKLETSGVSMGPTMLMPHGAVTVIVLPRTENEYVISMTIQASIFYRGPPDFTQCMGTPCECPKHKHPNQNLY